MKEKKLDTITNLFEGSEALFRFANILKELTTICECGEYAIFNARQVNGQYVCEGEQIQIDGNSNCTYISLCPRCYKEKVENKNIEQERAKVRKRTKNINF